MTLATLGSTRSHTKKASRWSRLSYPICITGKRNCPPEDCGGIWGCEELLAILANPTHPEHVERIDWIGEKFNPDEFDLEHANTVLAARFTKK
ncbi:plasmid pRiA4b ORF-3 family protein [Mesorhizobium sp. M0915]